MKKTLTKNRTNHVRTKQVDLNIRMQTFVPPCRTSARLDGKMKNILRKD